MAFKPNWGELAATGVGALATALYYDQVAASAGSRQATQDAILGTALGGAFALFTGEAGLLNEVANGSWAGGLVWLALRG